MPEPSAILIPLLNPNELSSQLTRLYAKPGEFVEQDALIATCESTKGVEDLIAPRAGWVCGLHASAGDHVRAGETLCWIADDASWSAPAPRAANSDESRALGGGARLTQPARRLAESLGIDLKTLPIGPLITVDDLRRLETPTALDLPAGTCAEGALVVYGGGGHGKSLIELIQLEGKFQVLGVVDDGIKPGTRILDTAVLGGKAVLPELYQCGVRLAVNAVGGIGDIQSRIAVFRNLQKEGFHCPAVIHPAAFVEPSAVLADGVQVFPHAYIGSETQIGFGVIVNTAAVVSHDCSIGAYTNIAPGSLLAGSVNVGEAVLIGMGVTVNLQVLIGDRVKIGNSAVIKEDVPADSVVRAGAIWPISRRHSSSSEE
ncbi:MAG: NeuD/PglB/VioB family sugar acetyltransferase [Anaerolineales bacterium]|nr:NeuD/PglB/VioB family sugar acetyltransferase [Anaerolineales bacterium]